MNKAETSDNRYHLGVDLGTTFTAAAVERDGIVRMATLGLRHPEIPSVLAVIDHEVLIGGAAERRALNRPGSIAREFKRRIGDPTPIIVAGTPWSAEALTGRLLAHVLNHVKETEGAPPDTVVVTHPANWHEFKLDRLRQAMLLAGCENGELIPEPVAAARNYAAQGRISPGQHIAVFDFGGGTFDAAVLRATDNHSFVLLGEPKGLEQLGGVDLDEAVLAHVLASTGIDLSGLEDTIENRRAVSRLRLDCREAKESLSSDTAAYVPVMLPGIHTEIRLTRVEFETMIRQPLIDATTVMRSTIESADLAVSDIDAVLLVGGSSRIPLVSQVIGEQLALPVLSDAHPKHMVASGAALTPPPVTARVPQPHPNTEPPTTEQHPPDLVEKSATPEAAEPDRQSEEAASTDPEPIATEQDPTTDQNPVADTTTRSSLNTAASAETQSLPSETTESSPVATLKSQPPKPAPGDEETTQQPTLADDQTRTHKRTAIVAVLAALVVGGGAYLANNRTNLSSTGATDTTVLETITTETTSTTSKPADNNATATIDVGGSPETPLFAEGALWVPSRDSGTVSRIDPATNKVTATIDVGDHPRTPVFAHDALWVPNGASGTVSRIDPATNKVTATIDVGNLPSTPIFVNGALWVPNFSSSSITRIDPVTNTVTATIEVGRFPITPIFADGALWVPNQGSITRIDPATNTVTATIDVGGSPKTPVFADGALWVTNSDSGSDGGSVSRIDPATNNVTATIEVYEYPRTPVFADGAIWVTNRGPNTVSRIDPANNNVTHTMNVGRDPLTPVFAEGALWVPNEGSDNIKRIDPATNTVTATIDVGTDPGTPVFAEGALWVPNTGSGTVTRIDIGS